MYIEMGYLVWYFKKSTKSPRFVKAVLLSLWVFSEFASFGLALGSMSSIAISYGSNGPVFCSLKSDGSHSASCSGGNSVILRATPPQTGFAGLTGGDGFICGLLIDTKKPYCWGNNTFLEMGIPRNIINGSEYIDISAGDNHLCALQKGKKGNFFSAVDCWGYNMTTRHVFDDEIESITAGSDFNCGLFTKNRTVFCWGDEMNCDQINRIPKENKFRKISAGGFHVCGILEGKNVNSQVKCFGRSIDLEEEAIEIIPNFENKFGVVEMVPKDPMAEIVGGKFHACGIKTEDSGVVCWGYTIDDSTPPPKNVKLYEITAGDYFSCGVLSRSNQVPVCWGTGFPVSLPVPARLDRCKQDPCGPGYFRNDSVTCQSRGTHVCIRCSGICPFEKYEVRGCGPSSDRVCNFNCSKCVTAKCFVNCSVTNKRRKPFLVRFKAVIIQVASGVAFVVFAASVSVCYVRYKLRNCRCAMSAGGGDAASSAAGGQKDSGKVRPDLDDMKIRRARMFTYDELERATDGFKDESIVGKGSFSCVFKGRLRDGTVVAVKRAIISTDMKKNSKEFRTELDLLSRLNHAHLLNLLGYCEEGGERLLVYEYMSNGSLHEHLHGKNKGLREQLDWVRRVTIAVQAARGIEYLHGYACPPVIHRDIKSSNILIDEEFNARVADFGLSLLGNTNSSSPLAELPAGTLGYLDPEYYRLHYLTTKSDVYSFGVLLLEILSGRKAIDMRLEEGNNIVEWAVPMIKNGDVAAVLDPVLKPPSDLEALKRIANVASRCVRMRGKERPSMDKVTTALERGLAILMGSPSNDQPILPTEVVLGSSRMHKKSSGISSSRSEADVADTDDPRFEFRAPSWITFPSVTSSQRRKSSVSETDVEKNAENKNLRSLEEEIGPASPQENLFLQHNF